MLLIGCLLAFSIAVAPRFVLVLAWIFSQRWQAVWDGEWIWPLLGIIFLPFTTIMYLLAWQPAVAGGANIEGWDWMWILLGLLLDLSKWFGLWGNRAQATAQVQQYYPSGAPRYGSPGRSSAAISSAAISSGQVPPSTSPTASDHDTDPAAATTPPEVPGDDRPAG